MTRGTPRWIERIARLVPTLALFVFFAIPSISGPSTSGAPDLGLLEVSALKAGAGAWVLLDARPRAVYAEGHLPGARSFSWEDFTRTDPAGVPFKIRSPEELAKALGAKGIDERTAVVVYGDADKSWGGEGWSCWALAWIGHQGPIRLLDGGIQAWAGQGLAFEKGEEPAASETNVYHAQPRPEILAETAALKTGADSFSIVDVRSLKEWIGGHLPGAVRIPWDEFYAGPERRPLPPSEVRKLLEKNDVRLDRPVVYYCAGGIRSAYVWFVHQLSGLPSARNYEGGMEEWKRTR